MGSLQNSRRAGKPSGPVWDGVAPDEAAGGESQIVLKKQKDREGADIQPADREPQPAA